MSTEKQSKANTPTYSIAEKTSSAELVQLPPFQKNLYINQIRFLIYKLCKIFLNYVYLIVDLFYSIYSVFNLKTGSSLIGKCIIAAKTDKAIAKYHAQS